jgi:hypothetical protein
MLAGSQSIYSAPITVVAGKRRGRGEDSIFWDDAKNRYVGVVSLGYSASRTRVRKKVMGRTKTEVRDKLRELHSQVHFQRLPIQQVAIAPWLMTRGRATKARTYAARLAPMTNCAPDTSGDVSGANQSRWRGTRSPLSNEHPAIGGYRAVVFPGRHSVWSRCAGLVISR